MSAYVKALGFKVPIIAWSDEAVARNVRKAKEDRDLLMQNVNDIHVDLLPGNEKTGCMSYTVSLYPVLDCGGCKGCPCRNICYDLRHDVIKKDCKKYRLINSAIHKADPERYWKEIEEQINSLFCVFLRGNVGGDLTDEDFFYLFEMCKRNQRCTFQYFTKNYSGGNAAIKANDGIWPENLKLMYSRLPGLDCSNPYHVPETHINFGDGCPCTAPDFGSYFCKGNCTECWYKAEGCIGCKPGESVTFNAH